MNLAVRHMCLALALLCATANGESPPELPKLVVLVSIDSLRGDSIDRIRDRLGPNGFRHFLDQGFEFRNAHFRHAGTVTAAGHSTLVTGTNSGTHGVVGNSWFDTRTNERIYCTQDQRYQVHGEGADPHAGSSPANLLVPTLSDEMRSQLNSETRAFGVSTKDRSAILIAGREGKAFWFSKKLGRYSSSSYYFAADSLPAWMQRFQREQPITSFAGQKWNLLRDRSSYVLANHDARDQERPPPPWETEFPHSLPEDSSQLIRPFLHTPFADEYTLDFVEALLDGEDLGGSRSTDYLAISLSSTDYVGHAFGPNSLEYEDNLMRVDRTIGRLIELLGDRLGLMNVTIVLAADHGVDAIPEFRRQLCLSNEPGGPQGSSPFSSLMDPEHAYANPGGHSCRSGRHDPAVFVRSANAAMSEQFGVTEDLVAAYWHPNLYLDEAMLREKHLDLEEVSQSLANFMSEMEGIALALTREDLRSTSSTKDERIDLMRRGFHPSRSGHVVLTTEHSWYLYQDPWGDASMHGSPYAYDTHVPMLLAGFGIRHGSSERRVSPSDLAPTLARVMGFEMTRAQGSPLLDCLAEDLPADR